MSDPSLKRRQEVMLLPECLDDYVRADNPVRVLDAYVDSLDLGLLGFDVKTGGAPGRPSTYSAEALLKLLIYGYLNQIRSSRKLEAETHRNLEVIWLIERAHPDHWTINHFRKKNADAFKKVLRNFHGIADFLQLFGREIEAIDGSFFKALNNKSKNFTRAKLNRLEEKIDKAISEYTEALADGDDESEDPEKTTEEDAREVANLVPKGNLKELRAKKHRIEQLRSDCETNTSGQVSLNDPDSRLLQKGGRSVVGHNVQCVVDAQHHLIAHVEIVDAGNDAGQLRPMAKAGCEALGIEPDPEHPLKVLADAGYSNSVQMTECENSGIEVHLPVKETTAIKTVGFRIEDFRYDEDKDEYICPAHKRLTHHSDKRIKETNYRVYYNCAACKGCPQLAKCTRGKYRKVTVSEYREIEDRVKQRVTDNPEIYAQRKQIVEHPFGTLKSIWGYGQFSVTGKRGCEGELNLMALCYNWKRVLKERGFECVMKAITSPKLAKEAVMNRFRNRNKAVSGFLSSQPEYWSQIQFSC